MAGLSLKSIFRPKPGIAESENFLRQRLSSHRLDRTAFKRPEEAVAWYGAMQGQDYRHAKWAVGIRCAGVTEADVERAIADRTIIRTWAMRGTLHLIAADDAVWLLDLVGPRMIARAATNDARRFDLDDTAFAAAETALNRALRGKVLTRKETYASLERQGVSTSNQRGYHILARAALSGQICQGPPRDKEDTFVLLDEWLPPASPKPREEAQAELALRYFRSHGPATLDDFVWWSSLTVLEARAGLEAAKSLLIREVVGDVTYWLASEATPPPKRFPAAQLLPGFDEYVLGYVDRSHILANIPRAAVVHSNGIFRPTILVAGQIVGTWSLMKTPSVMNLMPEVYPELSARSERALDEALLRFGTFLGVPWEIQ
ncbi:MAG: winged helix DNA-binding domain-containing protein [Thermoflexales bacterium]